MPQRAQPGCDIQRPTEVDIRFQIERTALHVPETVETAAQLAPEIGRSERWITTRTGVVERRISDRSMAEMGALVAADALGGTPPDLLINASLTPMQLIPDSSVFIQRELGFSGIPSFSIHSTCLSFLVALQTAQALLVSGAHRRILIVSSEQGSVCRDFSEPESAALIGDGAAAVVVRATPDDQASEWLGFNMQTWPSGANDAELRGCGTRAHPNDPRTVPADNLFHMRGPRLYRLALTKVDAFLDDLFAASDVRRDDIDWVIPHQGSAAMLQAIPRFGFPASKVVNVLPQYGNCIAASLPMALAHANAAGQLQRGQTVLLYGTGAGLSMAGAILRF